VIATDSIHAWSGQELLDREDWRIDAAPALERDLDALLAWAGEHADPLATLKTSSLRLPGFDALAARARIALGADGPGAAWIRGLPTDPEAARLAYLALGCRLGDPLENYGRLYDVVDKGGSYLDKPIPVSQTRHTTSFHTDSARRETLPHVVALLCLQDATGGDSQLASASRVHEQMRREAPELLERLYRGYVRDIVTPGTEHTDEALLANCFPVYESRRDGTGLTFRYMRYWIEKGAERAGLDFEASDIEAMDLLDSMMADESLHAQLHLRPGDALFIDNRDIAHNRTPYEDLPEKSRHLVRMWISGERAA
jgi:alpha-ketoglutarate-dependent taurine dioxygenase